MRLNVRMISILKKNNFCQNKFNLIEDQVYRLLVIRQAIKYNIRVSNRIILQKLTHEKINILKF